MIDRYKDQEEYDANEAEAEDTVGELPSSSESIIDSNPSLAISAFSEYIIINDPLKTYAKDERPNETQNTIDIVINSSDDNGKLTLLIIIVSPFTYPNPSTCPSVCLD